LLQLRGKDTKIFILQNIYGKYLLKGGFYKIRNCLNFCMKSKILFWGLLIIHFLHFDFSKEPKSVKTLQKITAK